MKPFRLGILASGKGSNADAICSYLENHPKLRVLAIFSNKKEAGVKTVAEKYHVAFYHLPHNREFSKRLLSLCEFYGITHLILAGYLRKIPHAVLQRYPAKIINIHPALLPKFGGKGMYGIYVHQAVKDKGETSTGITIHLVDNLYDKGRIIFQKEMAINSEDTAAEIQEKVRTLEHKYYPKVIEQWILGQW